MSVIKIENEKFQELNIFQLFFNCFKYLLNLNLSLDC